MKYSIRYCGCYIMKLILSSPLLVLLLLLLLVLEALHKQCCAVETEYRIRGINR